MKIPGESRGSGVSFMPILERLPVLSSYARTRGWPYVISWLHRLTGIWLLMALSAYMYAFSSGQAPTVFDAPMKIPVQPISVFLAWASSLVVCFHALNGGRLILYELFGRRNDADMIRWVFGLTAAYAAMVGLMMLIENQHVSTFFLGVVTSFFGAIAAYVVASHLWKKRHSVLWKLQRISGSFLFTTLPAYFLFLHLNPALADGTQGTTVQMQDVFTRLVTLTLATSALYHAGYGLFSIAADYIPPGITRAGMTALIVILIVVFAVLAFRFILSV